MSDPATTGSRAHAAWAARLRRTASELWDATPETFPPDWEHFEALLGRLYVLADEMDHSLQPEDDLLKSRLNAGEHGLAREDPQGALVCYCGLAFTDSALLKEHVRSGG